MPDTFSAGYLHSLPAGLTVLLVHRQFVHRGQTYEHIDHARDDGLLSAEELADIPTDGALEQPVETANYQQTEGN